MVAEPLYTNSFVVDGIVPDQYGLRTVVEYRGTLLTVPHMTLSAHPPLDDHMEIIAPTPQRPSQQRQNQQQTPNSPSIRNPSPPPNTSRINNNNTTPNSSLTVPHAPNMDEGEAALRHLAQQIDISALGHIHPSFFAPLRCVPPLYQRNSSNARKILEQQQSSLQSKPPSNASTPAAKIVHSLKTALALVKTVALRSAPRRSSEHSLLAWHWADDLLAVSSGAELDRVCAYNFNSAEWEIPGERHHALYAIRCLAFRPFAGRVLALGCKAGLALLTGQKLDLLSSPRLSPSSAVSRHTNIVSLDWSPDGQFLATASADDGCVRMWDIATRISTHVSPGSFVRFCPDVDSRLLFVADAAGVNFRLWCTRTWTCERWGSLTGPVVAATWSPDGSVLLFSTEGQAAIHVLSVANRNTGKETSIAYVEMTSLPREGPGGVPIFLEMDPTSERLAVAYEVPDPDFDSDRSGDLTDDRHRRFAVALYSTQLRPVFNMTPIGYVSGPMGSGPPVGIKFKPKPVGNTGAVLACMWRSGEVTFTHLLYRPALNK